MAFRIGLNPSNFYALDQILVIKLAADLGSFENT